MSDKVKKTAADWKAEREAKPKPRVVITALEGGKPSQVEWKKTKGLPGAFSVFLVGENGQDQFTFHRPIGHVDKTVCPPDCWVMTPTSEIQTLLAGANDPREAQLSNLENQLLLEIAIAEGLLTRDEKGFHYYARTGLCRETTLAQADMSARAEEARLRAEHDAAQEGKTKKAEFRQHVSSTHFLAEEVVAAEKGLRELRRAKADVIGARVPRTYLTMGGPFRDKPQKRCMLVPNGANLQEAYAAVHRTLAQVLTDGHFIARRDLPPTPEKLAQVEQEIAGWKQTVQKIGAAAAKKDLDALVTTLGSTPAGTPVPTGTSPSPAKPSGGKGKTDTSPKGGSTGDASSSSSGEETWTVPPDWDGTIPSLEAFKALIGKLDVKNQKLLLDHVVPIYKKGGTPSKEWALEHFGPKKA